MKKLLIILPFLLGYSAVSQLKYPNLVQHALNNTKNRAEIEKALQYFYSTNDSVKIKSINFLVANMPIHQSYNYYWADSLNKRIEFNESEYPSFNKAIAALDVLKAKVGKIHPVAISYKDIDTIKAEEIIENVELAIKNYGSKKYDEDFFEYVLPYRVSVEPLENWRKLYTNKFLLEPNRVDLRDSVFMLRQREIRNWFQNTYKIEERTEPLPRLSALQLLSRAKGPCEDIAGVASFIARSQGYPATVDFIPAWATASGLHFLNYINIPTQAKKHYDVADGFVSDTLSREPSKVLRMTYSKQLSTIASLLNDDTSNIPNNFMRLHNYKDVTREYWVTSDIRTPVFRLKDTSVKVSYLCVWNWGNWSPVWYSQLKNEKGQFVANYTDMAKGAVYLPMYYLNRNFVPAAWPIVINYQGPQVVLLPDTIGRRSIKLESQANYLLLRPEKKYTLYYWNMGWINAGTQVAADAFSKLTFNNIPNNVLMLLVPEYSVGKERPFIVDKNGIRYWY